MPVLHQQPSEFVNLTVNEFEMRSIRGALCRFRIDDDGSLHLMPMDGGDMLG